MREMLRRLANGAATGVGLAAAVLLVSVAYGTIISPLPYTFTNGTVADATQVNANFAQILANVNANAAANASAGGANLSGGGTLSAAAGKTGTISNTLTFSGTDGTTINFAPQSWTPSDQSGAGLVFPSTSVKYFQLGNLIFVFGQITYPATADGSNATIGGLPVTAANQDYATTIGSLAISGGLSTAVNVAVTKNSTTFILQNNEAGTNLINSQLSGKTVFFSFFYPTV